MGATFWKNIYTKLLTSGGLEFSDGRIKTNYAGSPEGNVTAIVGSECTDTSTGILYLKTSGSGNTGWSPTATSSTIVPVGTVIESARSSAPTNYLECDGSALSRTTYATLFSAISTTYGVGDGSTTFNIPDRRGNVGKGAGTSSGYTENVTITQGTKTNDTFQGHIHGANRIGYAYNVGSLSGSDTKVVGSINGGTLASYINDDPSTDGAHGTPRVDNVTQDKSLGMKYFIKYQ